MMTDSVTINTPDLHKKIFLELHALQRQGVACDVILAAVDGEIMAHKIILMAISTYFRRRLTTMLSEEEKYPKLFIQGVSITELASIVKYIYSGKLLLDTDSIGATLQVCEMLELDDAIKGYEDVMSRKPLKINTVYTPTNVNALESIPSVSSNEEQALYSRTASKQSTCLIEPDVINLSTEDGGFATEIQISSKTYQSTNQKDKSASISSSSNVFGTFKDAEDKCPSNISAVSVKQTLEYKGDEATELNKDSKEIVYNSSFSGDTDMLLHSSTDHSNGKQDSFVNPHVSSCGTTCTNVTRGRIMSVPSSVKNLKKRVMPGYSSHYELRDSPKPQKIISAPDKACSHYYDKECIPKAAKQTVKPISVIRRDNFVSSTAVHCSLPQCDGGSAEDSSTVTNATYLCSGNSAVIPLNIYKNVSNVEGATLHDKQPELLQNLDTGMSEPVVEQCFISKEHRVVHSEDEQTRLALHLTERAMESDTDKLDGGTISNISVTSQAELGFEASACNSYLEHTLNNVPSVNERHAENKRSNVCIDNSCTITETYEKTQVSKKPSWFVHESPRAATLITYYDRDLKESLSPTEFSEKRMKTYSEKTLHGTSDLEKKMSRTIKSDHKSDFKSTLNVPGEQERKVETQYRPVVRLRKLTEHEIMSWSTNKTQIRELVKKAKFPRVKLIDRRNEPPEKKCRKGDIVTSKSLSTAHEAADSLFYTRFLGKKYAINCTICNMKFRTVHELHQHFAEDLHRNNQQVNEVSEQMTCSVCEARFQMGQLLNDHGSQDDSTADFRWLCDCFSNRNSLTQKRPEPAFTKQTRSGRTVATKYSYKSSGISDDVLMQKLFRCHVCQFRTTKGYEYQFHMKQVHGKRPLYRCSAEGCSFSTYLMSKLTKHFRIKVCNQNGGRPHKTNQSVKPIKRWETVLGKVVNNSNGKNENRRIRKAGDEIPTSETEKCCKKRQRGGERITLLGRKAGRPYKNHNITERSAFILQSLKDRKIKIDVSVPGKARKAGEEKPTSETKKCCKKRQNDGERITILGRKTGRPHKNRSITERSSFILRSMKGRNIKTDVSVPGRARKAGEEKPTSESEKCCKKRQSDGERITILGRKAGRPHEHRSITERSAFIMQSYKDRKIKTDVSVPGRQESNADVELVGSFENETLGDKDSVYERDGKDVKPMGLMAQEERNPNVYGEGQRWGQSQTGPSSEEFGGHVNLAPGDYIVPDLSVIKMQKDHRDDNSGCA